MSLGTITIVLCTHASPLPAAVWDNVLEQARKGPLSPEQVQSARAAFGAHHEALTKTHGQSNPAVFGEPDRTQFFLDAMKMAVVDPVNHGGWPFRSSLVQKVADALELRMGEKSGAFDHFALLFAARAVGKDHQSAASFDKLRTMDPWLAGEAMKLAVRFGPNPAWWYEIYTRAGRNDDALAVGVLMSGTGVPRGLAEHARLLERLGRSQEAGAIYQKLADLSGMPALALPFFIQHDSARAEAIRREAFSATASPSAGGAFNPLLEPDWTVVLEVGEQVRKVNGADVNSWNQALAAAYESATQSVTAGKFTEVELWDGKAKRRVTIPTSKLYDLALADATLSLLPTR